MFSATPISPEQWCGTNGERMQQHADLAWLRDQAGEEANHRYAIITRADQETKTPARTVRRWRAQWAEALASYSNGLIGLLPQVKSRGHRRGRLDERTEELIEVFTTEHDETLKQQSEKAVFLLLKWGERLETVEMSLPKHTQAFLDRHSDSHEDS